MRVQLTQARHHPAPSALGELFRRGPGGSLPSVSRASPIGECDAPAGLGDAAGDRQRSGPDGDRPQVVDLDLDRGVGRPGRADPLGNSRPDSSRAEEAIASGSSPRDGLLPRWRFCHAADLAVRRVRAARRRSSARRTRRRWRPRSAPSPGARAGGRSRGRRPGRGSRG